MYYNNINNNGTSTKRTVANIIGGIVGVIICSAVLTYYDIIPDYFSLKRANLEIVDGSIERKIDPMDWDCEIITVDVKNTSKFNTAKRPMVSIYYYDYNGIKQAGDYEFLDDIKPGDTVTSKQRVRFDGFGDHMNYKIRAEVIWN